MVKVLLVEDDSVIARIIEYYLEQEANYTVVWAKTAGEAVAVAREHFDVILMDVLLPDINGVELCTKMREWQKCPIIFISCLDNSDTIVNALEAGGDDFITKPFDNKVLVARIEANIRRASSVPLDVTNNAIVCEGFSLDTNRHVVVRPGGEVKLSPQEYRILLFLMQNPNRFFSADELYRRVWGKDSYGDVRCVVVHVHNIRKKIEDPGRVRFLKNVWGKGYVFDPQGNGYPDGDSPCGDEA